MPRRLGIYNLVITAGGSLMILASCSFLSFLWFGNPNFYVWRSVVMYGWLTRSVTILSLIIRWAVGTQLTLCVSMLASIVMEHFEAPLYGVAAISMLRFQNSSPLDLLGLLRPAMTNFRGFSLGTITALLVVISYALQFTSTALLSDIGAGPITLQTAGKSTFYASNNTRDHNTASHSGFPSNSYLYTNPYFPVFAEYSEPAPISSDGVFDTGLSIRAFFPIASQNSRVLLRNYSGMATLFDTRVACVRPDPNITRFQFSYLDSSNREVFPSPISMTLLPRSARLLPKATVPPSGTFTPASVPIPLLAGYVGSSFTIPRFNGTAGMNFTCSFGTPQFDNGEWSVSLCVPKRVEFSGKMVSVMEPYPPLFDQTIDSFGQTGIYLVVNTTGDAADWTTLLYSGSNWSQRVGFSDFVEENEWLRLKTNVSSLGFSISLCYSAVDSMNAIIQASSTADNISEPTATWDIDKGTFDTTRIRGQLGVTKRSMIPDDRSIFNLSVLSSWLAYDSSGNYIRDDGIGPSNLFPVISPDAVHDFSLILCSTCLCMQCLPENMNVTDLHAVQMAVVNQILQTTNNAAKAIQALLTMLSSQTYYGEIDLFDISSPAKMWSEVLVVKPVRKRFFTVIMTLVVLHLLLVLVTVILFLTSTKYTLLGNAWHIISQFRGPEVEPWCKDQLTRDVDVKKCMHAEGVDNVLVGLEKSGNQIRVTKRSTHGRPK